MALFIRKYNEIFKRISFFLLILATSCNSSNKTKIRIACAANLEYTVEAIAEEFEKDCDCEVEIITASTGQLTNQIVQGAPFDVFLSASMKYDSFLRDQNLVAGNLKIFAEARLILWSMTIPDINENYLRSNDFNTIVIPNPKTAPVGDGAMDFLNTQEHLNHLRDRIVYGGSVSQVNQMISSGNVDLGITSKSAIYNPNLEDKGYWHEIGTLKHGSIFQTVVVLKNSPKIDLAEKFKDFLFTNEAKDILVEHGYDMPGERGF